MVSDRMLPGLPSFRHALVFIILLTLVGCAVLAGRTLDEKYGPSQARDRIRPSAELAGRSVEFWGQVKPILDRRCVVCHSCYDAPCQLKLTAMEGIQRGASKQQVYDSERLFASDPTRLFVDARTPAEWREKKFFPVLNERRQDEQTNALQSVLLRLLELKRNNPLPEGAVLPAGLFDFSIDRKQQCPTVEEIDDYEKKYPQGGMPYGCPAIPDPEFQTVKRWVMEGAEASPPPPLESALVGRIQAWERFLNGDSLKMRLVTRYIYEHLFLADLYFDEVNSKQSFKIVRSFTPPGEPVSIIATRRPTDDPAVPRVYYRLVPVEETTVSKTSMPYALNAWRMKRLTELFLEPPYKVSELPSYDPRLLGNPFVTFKQIPAESRYRFMLDDSLFFVTGFIKGPVCRGQTALNVIDERFWVLFVDPGASPADKSEEFLAEQSGNLFLPPGEQRALPALRDWRRYKKAEHKYLKARRKFLSGLHAQPRDGLSYLWPGTDQSANGSPALTIFRHYDSGTVVKGLAGETPKTAWVIGYMLFERIHYLLVANFDVFSNVGHQLLTRLYMDFMRIEGENNFLLFLPKNMREKEHAFWYRGIGAERNEYALAPENFDWAGDVIKYRTQDPKREFFELVRQRFGLAIDRSYELHTSDPSLLAISKLNGERTAVLPELSVIRVRKRDGGSDVYSLLLDRAHSNVGIIYLEDFRLLPKENAVTLVPGFLGAYPQAFFVVDEEALPDFAAALQQTSTEEDYRSLLDRYGVRRTDPNFWAHSDWFQEAQRARSDGQGVLDYSRFENR